MPLLLAYNKTKGAESQGVGEVHTIRKFIPVLWGGFVKLQGCYGLYVPINHHGLILFVEVSIQIILLIFYCKAYIRTAEFQVFVGCSGNKSLESKV